LSKGASQIPDFKKLSTSVENEFKRTVKDLQVYTISSMTRTTQKICDCQSWLRWAIANLAGGAVVVPMIIMVLAIPNQRNLDAWPSVVTVVVATSGFATLIAWASSSSHQDLMVAVATYAAVLVVFVGTQTSTS
jgi:Na+/melibiose symporter-like transporter